MSTPTDAARTCAARDAATPSATCRSDARMAFSDWPAASASPTRRLRERSPVHVSTRSPRPASPIKVSRLPPSAIDRRPVSASPRVISAARALLPKPRPSLAPAAMARIFLIAPPISTPTRSRSSLTYARKRAAHAGEASVVIPKTLCRRIGQLRGDRSLATVAQTARRLPRRSSRSRKSPATARHRAPLIRSMQREAPRPAARPAICDAKAFCRPRTKEPAPLARAWRRRCAGH